MPRGRPRKNTKEVKAYNNDNPQINIGWQLDEAGFAPGDEVRIEHGNGYVVIVPAEADTAATDLEPRYRDNIPDAPIESDFEAHTVGNRLWELGEQYEERVHVHVGEETKHLARRFHAYAKNGDTTHPDL